MRPFVTALIDTYNHERFIEDAILSVLEQDFPGSDMEILVVDDGSTDRTPEIVRKFAPRVRLLQKKNGGQASAINFGTAAAAGEIVAFLDGDDLWSPNKLSRVALELQKAPQAVMAYHRFRFWNMSDNSVWDGWFNPISGDVLSDKRKFLSYGAVPTSSLAFRRTALYRVMPVPEECSFMHDAYLIATTMCLGPVLAIDECLTKNRIHGENLWFAERGHFDPQVFHRRMKARQGAITSVRNWVSTNGSPLARRQVSLLLRSWELFQDRDEFQIKPPGRLRYCAHLWRQNFIYRPVMSRSHFAYSCAYATAALGLGYKNLHYMEGVRTRTKKLAGGFRRRAPQSGGAELT